MPNIRVIWVRVLLFWLVDMFRLSRNSVYILKPYLAATFLIRPPCDSGHLQIPKVSVISILRSPSSLSKP